MNEPLRADVLIAAARLEAGLNDGAEGEYPSELVVRLADALEAATGGRHIDAKYYAEVGRLRARVAELEAELEETKSVDIEAYRHLSRLHEIATERTVQLSAIIERARKAPPVETFEGGIRQDSVYTILELAAGVDHDGHEFCDTRLGCVLPEAEADR